MGLACSFIVRFAVCASRLVSEFFVCSSSKFTLFYYSYSSILLVGIACPCECVVSGEGCCARVHGCVRISAVVYMNIVCT